jgi:hypothetical protein
MNLLSPFRPTPTDDLAAQRRRRALDIARRTLPEFKYEDLAFGPFGAVEHKGHTFKVVRGLVDEIDSSSAIAFYVTAEGHAVYLEPLS